MSCNRIEFPYFKKEKKKDVISPVLFQKPQNIKFYPVKKEDITRIFQLNLTKTSSLEVPQCNCI